MQKPQSEGADNTKTYSTKPADLADVSDENLYQIDTDFNVLRNILHTYREWLLDAQATVKHR